MQIACKSCGQPITEINIDTGLAKCSKCQAIYSLSSDYGLSTVSSNKPTVAMPKNFKLSNERGNLVIERRWFGISTIPLCFFVIFWDSFLVFWYFMALNDAKGAGLENLPVLIFPLIHVAVGILLTYMAITGFVNKTRIQIGLGKLSIKHGPLPWPGDKIIDANQIEQLYCQKFAVHAKMKSGLTSVLIGSLSEYEQARYLEQKIEEVLRLKDVVVPGEAVGQ
jgi:hypothetical protein